MSDASLPSNSTRLAWPLRLHLAARRLGALIHDGPGCQHPSLARGARSDACSLIPDPFPSPDLSLLQRAAAHPADLLFLSSPGRAVTLAAGPFSSPARLAIDGPSKRVRSLVNAASKRRLYPAGSEAPAPEVAIGLALRGDETTAPAPAERGAATRPSTAA